MSIDVRSTEDRALPELGAASVSAHSPRSRRLLIRTTGWAVLAIGTILLPLPGPGSLVMIAGLRLLVPHYTWAARTYDFARDRALEAAAAGVRTWPRVALSALGPLWLAALAWAYAASVQIPRYTVGGLEIGPDLPFRSPASMFGLGISAAFTAALLVLTTLRWGPAARRQRHTGPSVMRAHRERGPQCLAWPPPCCRG